MRLLALLLGLAPLCGCGALRSDAVNELAEREVGYLKNLHEALGAVRPQVRQSVADLRTAWSNLELSFVLWEQEMERLRKHSVALRAVPGTDERAAKLAELAREALEGPDRRLRLSADFDERTRSLADALDRLTDAVGGMREQAREVQAYLDQSGPTMFMDSLDVAAIGGALGEFEEGRRLLEHVAELGGGVTRLADLLDSDQEAELEGFFDLLSGRIAELLATEPVKDAVESN